MLFAVSMSDDSKTSESEPRDWAYEDKVFLPGNTLRMTAWDSLSIKLILFTSGKSGAAASV